MTNLWTVFYFTLSITVTGALLLLFKRIFRDKLSARWHYLVWLVLLVRTLLPTGTRLFSSDFSLNAIWMEGMRRLRAAVELQRSSLLSSPFGMSGGDISLLKGTGIADWSVTDALFLVYLVGVAIVLCWDAAVYIRLRQEIRKGQEASVALREKLEQVSTRYDLSKQERVKVCDGFETPFLCGGFHPVLVIPSGMEETMDEKVLLHEMLHRKHHDVWVNFALHLLQALNWFNPFVYWLCRVIRNDSEALCDQRVLEYLEGAEKREYGFLLLGMADHRHSSRIGTTSMANGAKNIKIRVQRIADFGRVPKGAAFVTACITVVLGLASFSFAYEPTYFDTSWVKTEEDLERLLEEARYFQVTSPEMAISSFCEAMNENDLGKLALTVPQEKFEAYRAWALEEYDETKHTFGAQLGYGTKEGFPYRLYADKRLEEIYFFSSAADGSMEGCLHLTDTSAFRSQEDIPATERLLFFRIFEEEKGDWAIELQQEEHWFYDAEEYNPVSRALRKQVEAGNYKTYGDWQIADAVYCHDWQILMGGNVGFPMFSEKAKTRSFSQTLEPQASHAVFVRYVGDTEAFAAKTEQQDGAAIFALCPVEMAEETFWDTSCRTAENIQIGSSGSSSDGTGWRVEPVNGNEWIFVNAGQQAESIAEGIEKLDTPYELRIYARNREPLAKLPLKGDRLYE